MTTGACDSIIAMTLASDIGSDDLDTLRAELAAEQLARRERRLVPRVPRRWWHTSS